PPHAGGPRAVASVARRKASTTPPAMGRPGAVPPTGTDGPTPAAMQRAVDRLQAARTAADRGDRPEADRLIDAALEADPPPAASWPISTRGPAPTHRSGDDHPRRRPRRAGAGRTGPAPRPSAAGAAPHRHRRGRRPRGRGRALRRGARKPRADPTGRGGDPR